MRAYDHKQFMSWSVPVALGFPVLLIAILTAALARDLGIPRIFWRVLVAAFFCEPIIFVGLYLYLHVRDEGEGLGVRFGPIRSVRTVIPYKSMAGVEVTRSGPMLFRRPGVFLPARLGSSEAVLIHLTAATGKKRKVWSFVIGTDEPERLLEFLRSKSEAQPLGGPAP